MAMRTSPPRIEPITAPTSMRVASTVGGVIQKANGRRPPASGRTISLHVRARSRCGRAPEVTDHQEQVAQGFDGDVGTVLAGVEEAEGRQTRTPFMSAVTSKKPTARQTTTPAKHTSPRILKTPSGIFASHRPRRGGLGGDPSGASLSAPGPRPRVRPWARPPRARGRRETITWRIPDGIALGLGVARLVSQGAPGSKTTRSAAAPSLDDAPAGETEALGRDPGRAGDRVGEPALARSRVGPLEGPRERPVAARVRGRAAVSLGHRVRRDRAAREVEGSLDVLDLHHVAVGRPAPQALGVGRDHDERRLGRVLDPESARGVDERPASRRLRVSRRDEHDLVRRLPLGEPALRREEGFPSPPGSASLSRRRPSPFSAEGRIAFR